MITKYVFFFFTLVSRHKKAPSTGFTKSFKEEGCRKARLGVWPVLTQSMQALVCYILPRFGGRVPEGDTRSVACTECVRAAERGLWEGDGEEEVLPRQTAAGCTFFKLSGCVARAARYFTQNLQTVWEATRLARSAAPKTDY